MSKIIVLVTGLFALSEKTKSLNNENKSSIAIGGKINPKEDIKNEIIGGIKWGKFAFFLKILDDIKNSISAMADTTMYTIIPAKDALSCKSGGIK